MSGRSEKSNKSPRVSRKPKAPSPFAVGDVVLDKQLSPLPSAKKIPPICVKELSAANDGLLQIPQVSEPLSSPQDDKPRPKSKLRASVKIFVITCLTLALTAYCVASLLGEQMALTNVVISVLAVVVVILGAVLIGSIGWLTLKEELLKVPILEKIMNSFLNDWVRALACLSIGPVFCLYLLLSICSQSIRRCCHKQLSASQADLDRSSARVVCASVMLFSCMTFFLAYCFAFSDIGIGKAVFVYLDKKSHLAYYLLAGGLFALLMLRTFWDIKVLHHTNSILLFTCACGIGGGGMLLVGQFPQVPWLLFILNLLAVLAATKKYMFTASIIPASQYFKILGFSLFLVSAGCLATWLWNVFSGIHPDLAAFRKLHNLTGYPHMWWLNDVDKYYSTTMMWCSRAKTCMCTPLSEVSNRTTAYVTGSAPISDCLAAYMLWLNPALFALTGLFFAVVVAYLAAYHGREERALEQQSSHKKNDEIAGDDDDEESSGNGGRGAAGGGGGGVEAFSRANSFVAVRNRRWLTGHANRVLNHIGTWSNPTSVLIKVTWWGWIYFIFFVGFSKITTVFLSWLNSQLASYDFAVILAIFYAVGITMFLLPPVPGVPVYFFGGAVLVPAGAKDFGFGVSLSITIGVCFLLKMTAIFVQQKIIGGLMSGSVTVRSIVGVNTLGVKAIKSILTKPGMRRDKVAILIGGPDWPTSVLTGVLKLSVLKMLFGSLPVIFLVAPCVCATALLNLSGSTYQSLSSLAVALSGATQGGALLAAGLYIDKELSEKGEELRAEPADEAVAAIEAKSLRRKLAYQGATQWSRVPCPLKLLLVVSALAMTAGCYVLLIFDSKCFLSVALTDDFYTGPLKGNFVNLVLFPMGHSVLIGYGVSFLILVLWKLWCKCAVSSAMKEITDADVEEAEHRLIGSARTQPRLPVSEDNPPPNLIPPSSDMP